MIPFLQSSILSFFHDTLEIKIIMKSQGIPDYTAPPPIPDPPLKNEIFFDDIPDYNLWLKCTNGYLYLKSTILVFFTHYKH